MIIPFIHIESLAAAAYMLEPEGTDRDSFLLGFVAGVEALGRVLRDQSR